MIGNEAQSGITDDEIKDTLWNAYYDVEASLNSILGKLITGEGPIFKRSYMFSEEQNRRNAARERKGKHGPYSFA